MDVGDCLAVGVTHGEFDGFYSILQNGQWATPVATVPLNESPSTTSGLHGSACSSNGFCVGTGWYIPEGTESCLAVIVTFRTQLANTSAPTATGDPSVGNTLVADAGIWTNDPTFAYQWILNGSPISGATADSYEISSQDVGASLSVNVTASDGSNSVSAQSPNVNVTKGVLHPILKLIHKGAIRTGTVVTADVSDVPSGSIMYFKWIKDLGPIPHATQSSLKITSAFSEHILYFEVTISCPGYTTISKKSAPIVGWRSRQRLSNTDYSSSTLGSAVNLVGYFTYLAERFGSDSVSFFVNQSPPITRVRHPHFIS